MLQRQIKDIEQFLQTYRSFRYVDCPEINCAVLTGTLSVVDNAGDIWESYDVKLIIPKAGYPFIIPYVMETSSKIERDWDYHISSHGLCCLDVDHNLIINTKSGINLVEFYRKFIYPFFSNHQYKMREGNYANGEYDHHEKGIIQYYKEELKLADVNYIVELIQFVLGGEKHLPNNECTICGGRKFKKCCSKNIHALKKYGEQRLRLDLEIFKRHNINLA